MPHRTVSGHTHIEAPPSLSHISQHFTRTTTSDCADAAALTMGAKRARKKTSLTVWVHITYTGVEDEEPAWRADGGPMELSGGGWLHFPTAASG